jgi:formylglycine-generating enzyme required for sulfatase activity
MPTTLYTESPTLKRHLRSYTANGCSFQMVLVQKGSFHFQGDYKITFLADFELGLYPVKQRLWEAVMDGNLSYFKGTKRPVERVSWDDIMGTKDGKKQDKAKVGFLDRLNALPEIAAQNAAEGYNFGLPSESQWEYAASGGPYGLALGYEYAGSNYLPEVGWYDKNSQYQTHPVGRKLPNALGIYDMSGNVWEWCEDVWHHSYKDVREDSSPLITERKENVRVVRGGSWLINDDNCRTTYRNRGDAYFRGDGGLRLARYRVTL